MTASRATGAKMANADSSSKTADPQATRVKPTDTRSPSVVLPPPPDPEPVASHATEPVSSAPISLRAISEACAGGRPTTSPPFATQTATSKPATELVSSSSNSSPRVTPPHPSVYGPALARPAHTTGYITIAMSRRPSYREFGSDLSEQRHSRKPHRGRVRQAPANEEIQISLGSIISCARADCVQMHNHECY